MADVKPVVIGIAADSGCGKSTFMRRLTSIFGGESKLLDIGRETNTLVSDMTTVICLDDYHKWDRQGRKSNPEWPDGITALRPSSFSRVCTRCTTNASTRPSTSPCTSTSPT